MLSIYGNVFVNMIINIYYVNYKLNRYSKSMITFYLLKVSIYCVSSI